MKMFGIVGLVLCSLAFIFNIVGIAIPYWFYCSTTFQNESVSVYFGLWRFCGDRQEFSQQLCVSFERLFIKDFPHEFHMTRGLEILAVLVLAASIVLAFNKLFVKKDKTILMQIAGAVSFIAGTMMIAGATVFVTGDKIKHLTKSMKFNLHAGFALCIVSGFLSFVGGIAFFIDKNNSNTVEKNSNTVVTNSNTVEKVENNANVHIYEALSI